MTVRGSGYDDYGITEKEKDKILLFCQSNTDESNKILFKCAFMANPSIGADLFYSLSQDVSYERIDAIKTVPYMKKDFYGYRRLCVALIKKEMGTNN